MITTNTLVKDIWGEGRFYKTVLIYIFLFLLLILGHSLRAANYYWVGGSGNWSEINHWATTSGGNVFHVQVPSAFDDVYFDAGSFSAPGQSVTVNAGNYVCRNLNWSGVQFTPEFNSSGAFGLRIYGSMILSPDMIFNYAGPINFEATSPGFFIDMAGHQANVNLYFNGLGGGWTLQSPMDLMSGTLVLVNGSLNTAGFPVNCGTFYSSYSSSRTLNLSNSVINTKSWNINASNLAFNCGASTIIINSNYASFTNSGGAVTYHNIFINGSAGVASFVVNCNSRIIADSIKFRNNAKIYGNITVHDILLQNNFYELRPMDTLTVAGSMVTYGNCGSRTLICSAVDSIPAVIRPSGTSIVLDYILLKGVQAQVSAANGYSCTANNSIDLGNNAGWNINSPAPLNLYWVGGSGNWDDPQHWSLSSNGAGGACVPSPFDNVHFDAFSFTGSNQSVTINALNAYCGDMTWSGVLYNPGMDGPPLNTLHIYGSLAFETAMNLNFGGYTYFESKTTGKTLTSAGKTFKNNVIFKGAGGGWTLMDDLNTGPKAIGLKEGSLFTNNKMVSCASFGSAFSTPRTLTLGSSVINLTAGGAAAWNISAQGLAFDAGTSEINIGACDGGLQTTSGDTIVYYHVNFTGNSGMGKINSSAVTCKFRFVNFTNNGYLTGDNIYDSLYLASSLYILGAGKTQNIISYLGNNGSCAHYMNFRSSTDGTAAQLNKAGGIIDLDYMIVQDISAIGNAAFHANNSVDLSNNSGWMFTVPAPTDLYWVGGSGNWNDPAHWSFNSGGAGGSCVPTPFNNVYFDSLSFSGSDQKVTLTEINNFCQNMTWTGQQFLPEITGSSSTTLHVYGSLELCQNMEFDFSGTIFMKAAASGNVLTSAGHQFKNDLVFCGMGGQWMLGDDFKSTKGLQLMKGTFNTQGHKIQCQYIFSYWTNSRSIQLGNSEVYLTGNGSTTLYLQSYNLNFDAGTSKIYFINTFGGMRTLGSGSLAFHEIVFADSSGTSELNCATTLNTFQEVVFLGNGIISGNNTYDTLSFYPSKTYTLQSSKTQTILSQLNLCGNGCFPITLKSSIPGLQSTIAKTSGTVMAAYVEMMDQNATGGAGFYAGQYSVDLSGNSGWVFGTSSGYYYGLPDTLGVCPGDTIFIDTYNYTGAHDFEWQDGSHNMVYSATQPGTYWLTITYADNCFMTDTVNVVLNPLPFADAGNDVEICAGTAAILHAGGIQGSSFLWNNNVAGADNPVSPSSSSLYTVSVSNTCGVATDQVMVNVLFPPLLDAGEDILLCTAGEMAHLIANGTGIDSLYWSTGEDQPQIIIAPQTTTQYFVTAVNRCGSATDEIIVSIFNPNDINLEVKDENCNMANGMITASGFDSYNWSTGATTPVISGLTAGQYSVTVTQGQCSTQAEATVGMVPGPTADFTAGTMMSGPGQYNIACADQSQNAIFWTWNFGDSFSSGLQNPEHNYNEAGLYDVTLIVYDINHCSDTAVRTIEFIYSEMFYMPNTFTPNGDALNEFFGPVWTHRDWVKKYTFSIYDRWGGVVFTTDDPDTYWDGRMVKDHNKAPMGTYGWSLQLTDIAGHETSKLGHVLLYNSLKSLNP